VSDCGGDFANPSHRTWAESPGEGRGESPEHRVGIVNDIAIRELIDPEPVVDECVHPGRVACDLLRCAVVPLTQGLDDDVGPWKSEVNSDDSIAGASEDLLCVGSRERRGIDKSKKLSFEPAVPASTELERVDRVEQLGNPVPPLCCERDDPSVHKPLAELAVSKARVVRSNESFRRLGSCEIDDGPSPAGDGQTSDPAPIDERQRSGRVDSLTDAPDVSMPLGRDIERSTELEPVKSVESGGSWPACPDIAPNVEEQRSQLCGWPAWCAGQAIGVCSGLDEGAALDSAPKLVIRSA
jgi:hypothetical protein